MSESTISVSASGCSCASTEIPDDPSEVSKFSAYAVIIEFRASSSTAPVETISDNRPECCDLTSSKRPSSNLPTSSTGILSRSPEYLQIRIQLALPLSLAS